MQLKSALDQPLPHMNCSSLSLKELKTVAYRIKAWSLSLKLHTLLDSITNNNDATSYCPWVQEAKLCETVTNAESYLWPCC